MPNLQGWDTLLGWINDEHQFGVAAGYRSACGTLSRGLKVLRKRTLSQLGFEEGINLTTMLRWMYPSSGPKEIADMFAWLGFSELSKIQQTSPQVLTGEGLKMMEKQFRYYAGDRLEITAEDLAGGRNPDAYTKQYTLVDERVAHSVFGEKTITLPRFLELMCEQGVLGHPGVTRVATKDGCRLVRMVRPALAFDGWLNEEPSEAELAVRCSADALEAESLRWRRIAEPFGDRLRSISSPQQTVS